MQPVLLVPVLALALPVASFVKSVVHIRRRGAPLRQPPLRGVAVDELPAAVAAALAGPRRELEQLGFAPVACIEGFSATGAKFGIQGVLLCVHPARGDYAVVTAVASVGAAPGELAAAVSFSTALPDGTEINTEHSAMPALFAYPPERHVYRFPDRAAAAALYGTHRALVARHGGAGVRGVVHDAAGAVRRLEERGAADLAYQARMGRLEPTSDGAYRYSWAGALRGVWLLHRRLLPLHRARMRRRADRLLRTLPPEPGNPEPGAVARVA
jgi:hypothetical protein